MPVDGLHPMSLSSRECLHCPRWKSHGWELVPPKGCLKACVSEERDAAACPVLLTVPLSWEFPEVPSSKGGISEKQGMCGQPHLSTHYACRIDGCREKAIDDACSKKMGVILWGSVLILRGQMCLCNTKVLQPQCSVARLSIPGPWIALNDRKLWAMLERLRSLVQSNQLFWEVILYQMTAGPPLCQGRHVLLQLMWCTVGPQH